MSFIVVYITHSSADAARQTANYLLEKRLIACANIFPVQSAYYWQGQINHEQEYVALVKTRSSLWLQIKREIAAIHSYETPCIMKFEVEANTAYENWIYAETKETS